MNAAAQSNHGFRLPLIDLSNNLTRRRLLRRGVASQNYRLNAMPIHLYRCPNQAAPGQARPVLLVHGIADSALTWAAVLPELADIGPVYAVDLPGFGLSGAPAGRCSASFAEMVELLRTLITDVIGRPALVVGNSLGGWMATRLALDAPRNVAGVIMIDPGGALLDGAPSWQDFVELARVKNLHSVRRIYRRMFGQSLFFKLLYLDQKGFQALWLRKPVQQFIDDATEEIFLRSEDLRRIKTPVGLIWGLEDAFLPEGSFEFFRDNLHAMETLFLKGCGHLPQRERPREVITFIHAFAAKLASMN